MKINNVVITKTVVKQKTNVVVVDVAIADVIKKVVNVLVNVEKETVKKQKKIVVVALAIVEKTIVKMKDVVQNNNKKNVVD